MNGNGGKICSRCLVLKPISDYHRRSDRPNGVAPRCKQCVSEKNKEKNKDKVYAPKRAELSGLRFGKLVVIKITNHRNSRGTFLWECICDCGGKKYLTGSNLMSGDNKSCGCSSNELISKSMSKHGEVVGGRETAEYSAWKHMKARCTNIKNKQYHNYGGRGISVCNRWLDSFDNFLEDMGRRPTPKHSIDRFPNNNGNYEKSNCRWATPLEQMSNVRVNRLIKVGERELHIAAWKRELKLKSLHYFTKKYNKNKLSDSEILIMLAKRKNITI